MENKQPGTLFLIPNTIHPDTEKQVISPEILATVKKVDYYLVENVRTARRYLSQLMRLISDNERTAIEDLRFEKLDKNTPFEDVLEFMKPISQGSDCGIISESGSPGIADPGNMAVQIAHKKNIPVVPLSGPSSIFMALMASGMNGQSFAFQGYLPVEKPQLISEIRNLEKITTKSGQTQIFIETPYRNQRLFEILISTLNGHISLCIASNITGPDTFIKTQSVKEWKIDSLTLAKTPVVFLVSS